LPERCWDRNDRQEVLAELGSLCVVAAGNEPFHAAAVEWDDQPGGGRVMHLASSWPSDMNVAPLREIVDRNRRAGRARPTPTGSLANSPSRPGAIGNDDSPSPDHENYTLSIAVLLVGDLAAFMGGSSTSSKSCFPRHSSPT
jgi:hypothetical protein